MSIVYSGDKITFADSSVQSSAGTGFRNRIINGDMRIDQRNAGASLSTASGSSAYTLDRWQVIYDATSKFTVQQNAGSVTPPEGFSNYLGITSTSAYTVTSSQLFCVRQLIEGFNSADFKWGTAAAKPVTLSAWVYSSLTGTFGGSICNSANSRSYPFAYTISSANTWTQISITIPGDTTGTWVGSTNGVGLSVLFGLGVGSTFSGTAGAWTGTSNIFSATGATSVVGTSGATFYITGVQLEVGSSASSFEVRDYGRELAMCQRYYTKFTCPGSTVFMLGIINVTTNIYGGGLSLPATMRATPTLAQSALRCYDASASNTITAIASNQSSKEVVSAEFTTSGMTVGRSGVITGNDNSSAFISASAEL